MCRNAFPLGLRPQARVGAQPPQAALSAKTEGGPAGPDEGGLPASSRERAALADFALISPLGGQLLPREKPWEDTTMRYRTLDKNWQFNRVYGRGKSYVHPHCVLYVAKNRLGYTRIGLTATKKVGHAVQRNRARRVMRAALSEHLARNIGGYDIILVARGQTPRLKSTQLSKTLGKLFAKAGLPDKAAPAPGPETAPQ